ncbi:MAG: UDP-N-acetylmuramoyl-L-alanyl-D-glutamate--2,6-diaminopimelate ligase [Bacteroidales bacterium]
MKTLKDILNGIEVEQIVGSIAYRIGGIEFDSRKVRDGSLFVAVKGSQVDGHDYIGKAIAAGSRAIVCEEIPDFSNSDVTYIKVKNSAIALGEVASTFYDNPSSSLILIGVTGTNGKTTIASLLYSLFRSLGYTCGLISTIENKIEDEIINATHTTPDPVQLNKLMNKMVMEGCTYCFMEVSSHSIHQERIAGLKFSGGIFTNITRDHLDYHITFENYINAKKKFFDELPESAFALSNIDDRNGRFMLQNTIANKKTYSLKSASDFKCRIIENQFDGLQLEIDGQELWSHLIGAFNAYNLLAVYSTAILLGINKTEVLTALSTLETVEGRFEYIRSHSNIIGIVDYAHSPDALKNVLETIDFIRTHNETLITIVGAGGNRDKGKRPLMARVASLKSDKVILTSDNPRDEKPEAIIRDMEDGVDPENKRKVMTIINRKEAIKTACSFANPGDIILLAGKGHEKYQEINGVKHPFDDKELLKEFLLTQTMEN